ncbi:MAG: oligosaccharide flippase family protein [Lachnospiraceae bacterium]|nr:oligosaccharide flippase family protein [Lachnospiraceae bacterium]
MKIIKKYRLLPVHVKASLWFLCCSFLQKGITVLTTPVFTRLMSTTQYGEFSAFSSWKNIISIFVSFQLSYGVFTQGLIKYEDDRKAYASAMQTFSFVLCGSWTLLYLLSRTFWDRIFHLTTAQMLLMLITIWATSVFNFWAAVQRVELHYKALVLVTLLAAFGKSILGIAMVYIADDKVTARILAIALAEVICFSGLFVYQLRNGKTFCVPAYWKHAVQFNIPLIPHYLSQTVLNSSDRIMIARMVSEAHAGIYSIAYSIALLMTLFSTAITQTLEPWLYKKIKDRRENEIADVVYAALVFFALVNLLLIAFAPEMVAIFAPPAYREAIWVIPPVAMSTFFMFGYSIFAAFGFYYEKTSFVMYATVSGAVVNIVLNYLLIGRFGYLAAGYTTLFCYILFACAHYYFSVRICDRYMDGARPYNAGVLVLVSAAFMSAGFLMLFLYNHRILRYAAVAVICAGFVLYRKPIMQILTMTLRIRKKSEN